MTGHAVGTVSSTPLKAMTCLPVATETSPSVEDVTPPLDIGDTGGEDREMGRLDPHAVTSRPSATTQNARRCTTTRRPSPAFRFSAAHEGQLEVMPSTIRRPTLHRNAHSHIGISRPVFKIDPERTTFGISAHDAVRADVRAVAAVLVIASPDGLISGAEVETGTR